MWLELLLFALSSPMSSAGVVEYNLTIGYFIARPDGRPVTVLGINGQLPSPTLEVTRGDTLVVHVHNNDQAHAHSLHWHGRVRVRELLHASSGEWAHPSAIDNTVRPRSR